MVVSVYSGSQGVHAEPARASLFPGESRHNGPWAVKRELSCRSWSLHWARNVSEGGGWERWRYRRDSGNQTPDPASAPSLLGSLRHHGNSRRRPGGAWRQSLPNPLMPHTHTHTEWQLRLGQQSTLWHSSSERYMGVSTHLVFGCVA